MYNVAYLLSVYIIINTYYCQYLPNYHVVLELVDYYPALRIRTQHGYIRKDQYPLEYIFRRQVCTMPSS